MICVRCDRAIRPGEPYDTHIHHGATLPGCTNHTHQGACPEPDRTGTARNAPTAPASAPASASG